MSGTVQPAPCPCARSLVTLGRYLPSCATRGNRRYARHPANGGVVAARTELADPGVGVLGWERPVMPVSVISSVRADAGSGFDSVGQRAEVAGCQARAGICLDPVAGAGERRHGQRCPVMALRVAGRVAEQADAVSDGDQLVRAAEDRQVRAAKAQRIRDWIVVLLAPDECPQALVHAGPVAGECGRVPGGVDEPRRLGEAAVVSARLNEAIVDGQRAVDVLLCGPAGLPQVAGQRVPFLGGGVSPGSCW